MFNELSAQASSWPLSHVNLVRLNSLQAAPTLAAADTATASAAVRRHLNTAHYFSLPVEIPSVRPLQHGQSSCQRNQR